LLFVTDSSEDSSSQDLGNGHWGQYDDRKQPTEDLCYLDKSTLVEAWPGLSKEEAAKRYHSKESAESDGKLPFKPVFQAARALKEKMLKGESIPAFLKPESVRALKSQSLIVYTEFAFVSESELTALVDASSKALKMPKPIQMTIEDGSKLNGWALSLRGLSPEQHAGLRKFRIEQSASTQYSEHLLQESMQIRKDQGQMLYQHVCEAISEKRPSVARPSGRPHLLSVENLKRKAAELMEACPTSGVLLKIHQIFV